MAEEAANGAVTIMASSGAGLLGRLLCHPIDTVKAKLQSGDSFRGVTDVIRTTAKTEGVRGFYKGLAAVLVGGVPGVCIYMSTYELSKQYLNQNSVCANYTFLSYLSSGMIAEAVCCAVFVPVDVVKERLQVQSNQLHYAHSSTSYKGSLDAFKTILRLEGLRGLYKGYGATVFSYGPYSALYFLCYEEAKRFTFKRKQQQYQEQHHSAVRSKASVNAQVVEGESPSSFDILQNDKIDFDNRELDFKENLICAAIAGSIASYLTNPLDLAKLRYQIQREETAEEIISQHHSTNNTIAKTINNNTATATATTARAKLSTSSSSEVHYKGLVDALGKLYRQHGLKGLFRGASARVLFFMPSAAITMAAYEEFKRMLS